MKTIKAFILTLLLCLAGCGDKDAAKVLATIDDSGGSGSSNSSAVTSKTYNASVGGVYESFTFKTDGNLEYYQVHTGIGWIKGVGTYSFNATTSLMTIAMNITEASGYFVTNVTNICNAPMAGDIAYTEVDANTYTFPSPGGAPRDYIIDSLSGVTVPSEITSMADACP